MKRLLAAFFVLLAAALPAQAHKLRVFATVEGAEITGYAFFVGGGRAEGAPWQALMASAPLAEGKTGDEGRFRLAVPAQVAGDITVTVNTQEGHMASATLPVARFTGAAPAAPVSAAAPRAAVDAPVSPLDDAALIRIVEGAVQRQIAPLEAEIAEMRDRLRLVDVISGVMLIAGLAGVGLWARGRRPA